MTRQHYDANLQASPATLSSKRPQSKMTSSGDTLSKRKRPAKDPGQSNVSMSILRNSLFFRYYGRFNFRFNQSTSS